MVTELRMPNINGNEREQLAQIRSYLYQLIPQLQWALENVGDSNITSEKVEAIVKKVSASAPATPSTVDANIAFEKLKPLIIESAEIVAAYYPKIINELNSVYFAGSSFGTFVETTNKIKTETASYTDEKFNSTQVLISNTNASVEAIEAKNEELSKSLGDTNKAVGDADEKISSALGAVEDVKGDIKASEALIDGLKGAIEAAKNGIDKLNATIIATEAYIKSGELYEEDGIPVYGVEVGQENTVNGTKVFRRFARFISNKLSFYDQNDTEVAYISDYKLYITNVEITGTLKLGGFLIDSSRGFTIKWTGRG